VSGPFDLRPVPEPTAELHTIWEFALTWNGYNRRGGFQPAADVANRVSQAWRNGDQLPEDVDDLRTALFFEQRRYRHSDTTPTGRGADYVRALVGRFAALGGGRITGPCDPLP
jgi:hypothetical protein